MESLNYYLVPHFGLRRRLIGVGFLADYAFFLDVRRTIIYCTTLCCSTRRDRHPGARSQMLRPWKLKNCVRNVTRPEVALKYLTKHNMVTSPAALVVEKPRCLFANKLRVAKELGAMLQLGIAYQTKAFERHHYITLLVGIVLSIWYVLRKYNLYINLW